MAHLITRLKCRSGQLEKGIIMNKNKLWLFLVGALTLNIAAALTLTGCDNPTDPTPEEPKPQAGTAYFGTNLSMTVKGTFKDSEWNGVLSKVENAIKAGYGSIPGLFDFYLSGHPEAEITLEKSDKYNQYSTTFNSDIIKINTQIINNSQNLSNAIIDAMKANTSNTPPFQVMNHNKGWKKYGQAQRNIDNHIASSRVRHRLG